MTTISPPSLPPISDADWPETIKDMRGDFAGRLNVYRVMAHHPDLLRAWADLRDHVVLKNALGAQRSEIVILRAAARLESDYEWQHHVSRSRACGLDDARIASLTGLIEDMEPEDAVIARAVDDLFDYARLSSTTVTALSTLIGTKGMLDVIATVGFYSTLGFILRTFETPIDQSIQEEMNDRPLRSG